MNFDDIARKAWKDSETPLEQMYNHWLGRSWEPDPPAVTFRIFDLLGNPIYCHLCGAADKWVVEGDEVRQVAKVFVCEHEPIVAGRGMIRQVSTVPVNKVSRFEEASRPPE